MIFVDLAHKGVYRNNDLIRWWGTCCGARLLFEDFHVLDIIWGTGCLADVIFLQIANLAAAIRTTWGTRILYSEWCIIMFFLSSFSVLPHTYLQATSFSPPFWQFLLIVEWLSRFEQPQVDQTFAGARHGLQQGKPADPPTSINSDAVRWLMDVDGC